MSRSYIEAVVLQKIDDHGPPSNEALGPNPFEAVSEPGTRQDGSSTFVDSQSLEIPAFKRLKQERRGDQALVSEPLPPWLSVLGLGGTIVRATSPENRYYLMFLWLKVPCLRSATNFGYILQIAVGFVHPVLPVVEIVTANLVPEDAPIMRASARGDARRVLALLNGGESTLNDVTPENYTPLHAGATFRTGKALIS